MPFASVAPTDFDVRGPTAVTTYLFTDIEGSTRLWEQEQARMPQALACHDALVKGAVESHRGIVVKMTGDGVHAVFDDPLDGIAAALALQQAMTAPDATNGVGLKVRCGLHVGPGERRDNDFFGVHVNRAARIMAAAHGGQILISHSLREFVADRLPAGVTLRDLGSVRLRDLSNPEHVFQIVHPQLRRDFPALRSLEATPNNLPQQTSSFVGRERELADVKERLRDVRLLTLLGMGGLGKTRLALQVAAEVLGHYPDGVWFVELAPVVDPRLVPQAVASVLGVTEEPGRPVQEALVKHVKDRRMLLVLDNCEHLTQACADLAKALLQSGPQLRILASSREHLHVSGEATFQLPTLAVPEPTAKLDPSTMTQYEAVHLFVDRAMAAQPSFRLTADNAAHVADICQRLDGIPLALELAAARVRALSVDKIAERLTDRFRLLVGSDRTVLPRQQTLRALIDWSYDLLTEPERTLLRRLSVFKGGFTLEAAEKVGAGGDLAEIDVLDVLSRLVEKSLVVMDAQGERYFFLETVRQYAHERLDATNEASATRARHLRFYVDFAESADRNIRGPETAAWLSRLDVERENLFVAHAACDAAEDGAELDLRLAHSLKFFCVNRGLLSLGHQVTVEALARPGAQQHSILRSRGLFDAGQLGCFMGRYRDAQQHLRESLAIARELSDQNRVAAVLQPLGLAALGLGQTSEARDHLTEALALARTLGKKRDIAAALNALAQVHRVEGDMDAADSLYESVLEFAREIGDSESIAIGLLNLAMVAVGRGLAARARQILHEVMSIYEETGSKPVAQSLLEVTCGLGCLAGAWEQAARFYGSAEAQSAQTGLRRDPADEAFLAPLIARVRYALGVPAFAAAESAGRALGHDAAMDELSRWLRSEPGPPS